MINSMTGFGHTAREVDGIFYTVEAKTVNSRFLKVSVRLPEGFGFVEDEIEKLVRKNIDRGSAVISVYKKQVSDEPICRINTKLFKSYLEEIKKAAQDSGLEISAVDAGGIVDLPGVLEDSFYGQEQMDKIRSSILEVASEAIGKLKDMRKQEGAALADDLKDNCEQIRARLSDIEQRVDVVLQEYHEKLKLRADVLLEQGRTNIDGDILAREVAIFAERSDISEEIVRLKAHMDNFIQTIEVGGSAGRKLDFISQEMLREANTIASKAADAAIGKNIVEIKANIERIKEQVQNVE